MGAAKPIASNTDETAFSLLLACADWPQGEARDRAIRAAVRELDGDWARFLALVRRHHLSIAAEQALRVADVEFPAELTGLATGAKRRALLLAGEAVRIVAMLTDAGIEVVPIKGPVLSQQIYGDPAMRQSVDIDLLVGWRDFRRAFDEMRGHGFRLLGNEPPWGDWRIETWRTLAKDVTLVDPSGRLCVELHHRLKSPSALLPGIGFEQATDTVQMAGREFRTFEPRDLFVYLCVHGATSFWDRLKWLADIRAMVSGISLVELEQWHSHSESLGTERCTALALALCHRLWGQELPVSVARLRDDAPWLADLEATSLRRLRSPERKPTSLANSFDRRQLLKLRADATYRRAQFSELVNDHELIATVRLPRAMRALYAPLRMLLFIRRKLGLAPDPRLRQAS